MLLSRKPHRLVLVAAVLYIVWLQAYYPIFRLAGFVGFDGDWK
jgi:hypothetical protein